MIGVDIIRVGKNRFALLFKDFSRDSKVEDLADVTQYEKPGFPVK